MRYRIEYAEGRCKNFANGREDLLEWLKLLHEEAITDIKKEYENGKSVSVMNKYEKYIDRTHKQPKKRRGR